MESGKRKEPSPSVLKEMAKALGVLFEELLQATGILDDYYIEKGREFVAARSDLFSGFVFCGDCKHTMVRKTVPSGGKKYHYLICSTNKAGKGCSPHTFSEDKLKAIVLRVVNDHIELIAQVEQVLDYIA